MVFRRAIRASYQGIKPRAVIADWDETITLEDTIRLVSDTAYFARPDFKPEFSYFSEVYRKAYNEYSMTFLKENGPRTTIEKEIQFHIGMRQVEMSSINEITEKGLFEGLSKSQFEEQSKNIKIRPYFFDFLRECEQLQIPVIILSINWTGIIMEKILNDNGFALGKNLKIIVNEFEFKNSKTSGKWLSNPTVRTGIDKVNIVKEIRKEYGKILFVGDSSTDILSLIEADYGVVMEGGSVISSLKKLGINFKTLEDNPVNKKGVYLGNWKNLLKFIEN